MELKDKVVFLSGAGGGIGRAMAQRFIEAGAAICITDRREDTLGETLAGLTGSTKRVISLAGDITDPAFVTDAVARTVAEFGGLDAAVNNAGFFPPYTDLVSIEEALARQVMEVDFWGVFHAMRAQIPVMLARGSGSVVNIASGAGLLGFPMSTIYCAAKHAVLGITRAAALDHSAQGIRVNAICPGMIATPPLLAELEDPALAARAKALHPIGRIGQPEEIADAALWLASDRSSFVTGTAIPVDGGFTAQ